MEKKEVKHHLTPDEKKLIHKEREELEEKQKQKVKGHTSEVFSRGRLAELKRTMRMKTSLRPQRRKG
ncbi:MAG: hypothetical protein ACPL6C_01185 [bacterium]